MSVLPSKLHQHSHALATAADGQVGDATYRLLVEGVANYALYMMHPDGSIATWSIGAKRLKGYTASEAIGEHFSCFYDAADRLAGVPASALERALVDGHFESHGWRVRKDGTRFWAHMYIDPIRRADGSLAGFANITRDCTEERQQAQVSQQRDLQFERLVQSVPDHALYLLDPDGTIASWNVGAERIKGYKADEIVGANFSRFYNEADRLAGVPAQNLEKARRDGIFRTEGMRLRKDGSEFLAQVVIAPILRENGSLLGVRPECRPVSVPATLLQVWENSPASG